MTTQAHKITVAEFRAMPEILGHRYELVDGELIDMDGAPKHGAVTGEIYLLIRLHIRRSGLSLVVGVSTGFRMSPDTLRFPDVHVTHRVRMAEYNDNAGGFPDFAPDVAIEVASPTNTPADLERKTEEYFANGTRAVWIADPVPRTVAIRRPGQPEQVFGVGDLLSGEPEIPGFACAVADIFAALDQFERPAGSQAG